MDGTPPPPAEITRILHEWKGGKSEALDKLLPIIYDELRVIASRQLTHEWRHLCTARRYVLLLLMASLLLRRRQ